MSRTHLTDRDVSLFHFLWQWKVLTTTAIWKRFFPNTDPTTAYGRMQKLWQAGFVQWRSIDDNGSGFVWTLTDKGYQIIKNQLGVDELREDGFRSEHLLHDLHATALHVGDFLTGIHPQMALFSEQELRRHHPEMYPPWVPTSELHRPDGYWQVPLSEKIIVVALEMELNQQRDIRYQLIAHFYADLTAIFRIVWVISKTSLAQHIQSVLAEARPDLADIHDIILLEDFKNNGWQAKFIYGLEKGRTLYELLHSGASKPSPTSLASALLDTRKYPSILNSSFPAKIFPVSV